MDVLQICAKMIRDAVGTMSTKFSAHVKDEINTKVSSLYKPGGTATLATLPALTADNAGYVYDMSEAFVTTASFREGAGHKYPAGTNVVVSDVGNGVYKYDVLSGMLDGYVQESRKIGNVPLSADIPVTLTGDTAITVTNTGTASAIGYSITHDDSGVTAGSKGDTTNQTPGFGGTFKALSATVDAKGHVTSLGDHTVKVPSDTATTSKDGLMSKADKAKLDAIGVTATNPLEVTKTGETYNVTLKDSGVTAGSKGDTTNQTPSFGGTFKALSATVDAKGRITSLAEHSVQVPDTEATQSAKGLMSAADKTKLDTLIDATLSNTGQAADAKATGDKITSLESENALLCELINGIDAPIYRNTSGNPATFADGYAANVKALSVEIAPTQSGSGEPSPTNIRPISGVSSVSVTRMGENGANPQTVTVQLTDGSAPLTVYGGTLDVTTGELTVTTHYFDASTLLWKDSVAYPGSFFSGIAKEYGAPYHAKIWCSHAKTVNTLKEYVKGTCYSDNSFNIRIMEPGATLNEWTTFLQEQSDAGTPVQMLFKLATPVTYQLTPAQLATLSGYNSVTTDAGTLSVAYRADPAITLGGG